MHSNPKIFFKTLFAVAVCFIAMQISCVTKGTGCIKIEAEDFTNTNLSIKKLPHGILLKDGMFASYTIDIPADGR